MRFIIILMSDKIKNYLIIGMALFIAIWFVFKSCGGPKPIAPINIPELERQDSFRTVIRYHDSTRLTVLKKWRTITQIHDSVKCYTEIVPFIQACDTVIKADSTLIVALKEQHINDTIIQVKLFDRVYKDSVLIVKLNKKVKRNKVLAKVAFVTGLLGGGFVGFKVKS